MQPDVKHYGVSVPHQQDQAFDPANESVQRLNVLIQQAQMLQPQ